MKPSNRLMMWMKSVLRAPSFRLFSGERVGDQGPQQAWPSSRSSAHFAFWIKGAQALALAVAVCFSVGATEPNSRLSDLDHRLMCTCGCAEILGECNHVGCPNSTGELNELRAGIAKGLSDKEILDTFVAKYGALVLAAPTTHGFDLVAWIAPFAVFAAALLGTILLVRRWSVGKAQSETPGPDPAMEALRDKIRRETE
jgi:cytochrome c-type biogenesis protein CcmH